MSQTSLPIKNMTCYIAGPMTGLPNWNFPAFNEMQRRLEVLGINTVNPATLCNGDTTQSYEYYMAKNIEQLVKCNALVVLNGWRKSKGACLEVEIAKNLKFPIMDEDLGLIEDETICQEADRLVSEDRGNNYGHPFHDFTRTGRIWGAILDIPDVPPEKVGLCMIGVKLSRETHKHKIDNLVDSAGYAKTIDMIHEYKETLIVPEA